MGTVRVEQGVVSGLESEGVHRFLGLPYAAPPVGQRRWLPPAPPHPWNGVRDASSFGPASIQSFAAPIDLRAEQSEDCLNLNVWTSTTEPGALQPVMVWIHGGGFLNGSASVRQYDGENLARHGATVVALNYRLGAFGFANHPELGSNFAVLDWIAALKWVQTNTTFFGGDPGNVTIFGQSAGAAAVRTLLSAPAARGLFHRAIIQSAGFEDYASVASPTYERSRGATKKLFDQLGSHDLATLRQLPADKVREASLALSGIFPPPGQVHTPANLVWYPVIDDDVVEDDFSGWPSDVPVMLGCTQDEARFFVRPSGLYSDPGRDPSEIYTPATLQQMARKLGGQRSDEILAHYQASGMSPYEALAELFSAAIWFEPALATLQRFDALGDRTVYSYRFTRVSPGGLESGVLAHHSAEVPYVFAQFHPDAAYDERDAQVSRAVQHSWLEFARTGVPRNPDGSPWPAYDSTARAITLIGDTTTTAQLTPGPVTTMIGSARSAAPESAAKGLVAR